MNIIERLVLKLSEISSSRMLAAAPLKLPPPLTLFLDLTFQKPFFLNLFYFFFVILKNNKCLYLQWYTEQSNSLILKIRMAACSVQNDSN